MCECRTRISANIVLTEYVHSALPLEPRDVLEFERSHELYFTMVCAEQLHVWKLANARAKQKLYFGVSAVNCAIDCQLYVANSLLN